MGYRSVSKAIAIVCFLAAASEIVAAHGGGLPSASSGRLAVPTWLFVLTGGAVVSVSFLLTCFVTDPHLVDSIRSWSRSYAFPRTRAVLTAGGRAVGLFGLLVVVVAGTVGPSEPLRNSAVLLVWVGWWAGYTMTVYSFGNTWPAINPFYTLARPFDAERYDYPDRLGEWPAAAGLLLLILVEIVSRSAEDPRWLAWAAIGYLLVTLVGATLVGTESWFRHVDPIAGVFRQYGKVAPVKPAGRGVTITLPGSALGSEPVSDLSEVGLIIALVWGTTFDGFVRTPLWSVLAQWLVDAGVPAAMLYPLVLLVGYLLFTAIYWGAARAVRSAAPTCLSRDVLVRAFAPSLVAIAVGYHLAHYLNYFLTLSPALLQAVASPLQPAPLTTLTLPGWVGSLPAIFVLSGHFLAIWIAHGVAFDLFPGRVQAIRSQVPISVVMIVYTMVSLWTVGQPYTEPPYL